MPAPRKIKPSTPKGWDHPLQAFAYPRRCAAVLWLADSVDRDHRQTVRRAHATLQEASLRPGLEGEGDMLLELWAL